MILSCLGTGCRFIVKTWCCTMSFCMVLVISVCKILRHQSSLSAVSLEKMFFHKPASWILLSCLNSLREGWWWGGGVWIPFLELVLTHAVIPIAASTHVWRNIYALGSDFPGLRKQILFMWFTKTPYRPDCSLKKARFSPAAILCRIILGPVVPAPLHTTLLWQNGFSRRDRQRQRCCSHVAWGDNCLKHPSDFLEGDQKTVAAPGDSCNWSPNGQLSAAKRQTFPSDFCCALVPIDYWGKCIMLAKISFPWSNVCFISHINASMTLSLLQHIKHLGNVSLNSRSVLWNPSTWE